MRSAAMPISRTRQISREKPNLRPNQRRMILRRLMPANRVGAMSSGPLAIVAGAFQKRKILTPQTRKVRPGGCRGRSPSLARRLGARDIGFLGVARSPRRAVHGLHEMEVRGVQLRLCDNSQTHMILAVASQGHIGMTLVGSAVRAGVQIGQRRTT